MIKCNKGNRRFFMRKSIFLTLVLSLCVVDFCAFAATSRRAATTNAATARSSAPVAARAAKAVAVPQKTASTTKPGVTARAATQKVLNMGTKVSTATANTAVDEDCQNAYYGCMDAFCMLDNAAGGRCQCSDRISELNEALDEILKLDEQSVRIATEGVERVQMGDYADQITSRAKSIETEFSTSTNSAKANSTSQKRLDLTSLLTTNIFDVATDDDDLFVADVAYNDIADKTGDALQNAAAKVCVERIPSACKNSSTLLQMAYVQKVRSDCIAFENALKQQKMASQQKLLTAQKAVREAVLTDVREKNKYETTGECAVAFDRCMQTTAGCKSDYTGCVTLAASENVRNNKSGPAAKQTTIKGVVSGADITLAASTMEQLLAKKEICASVTRQCVNANRNDAVWNLYLRNVAPVLKSAELIAEQDLRSNCLPAAAECFKNACRAQFLEDEESYDMCLSNPSYYKNACKVQLEPCLEMSGGSFDKPEASSLWNSLVAMLNAMKVDACTQQVKSCITKRCGDDYLECIGLDTYSIGKLCLTDELTACMTATDPKDGTPYYKDEDAIREYVAQVAQGLALQIDNALAVACQNAADEAMINVCGDTENCDGIELDLNAMKNVMKVQACSINADGTGTCLPDVTQFSEDEVYSLDYSSKTEDAKLVRKSNQYGVYAKLLNQPDISNIVFGSENEKFYAQNVANGVNDNGAATSVNDFSQKSTDATAAILQGVFDRLMGQIESDPKVIYCKTGREVQGFKAGEKFGTRGGKNARFPELTDKYKYVVAQGLLSSMYEEMSKIQEDFDEDISEMDKSIAKRVAEIAKKRGDNVEVVIDGQNEKTCAAKTPSKDNGIIYRFGGYDDEVSRLIITSSYDSQNNVCTVTKKLEVCVRTYWSGYHGKRVCESSGWQESETTREEIPMSKVQ